MLGLSKTAQYLVDKYGTLSFNTRQLSAIFNVDERDVLNLVNAGEFPLRTTGKGKFLQVHAEEVAGWLDAKQGLNVMCDDSKNLVKLDRETALEALVAVSALIEERKAKGFPEDRIAHLREVRQNLFEAYRNANR